MSAAWSSITFWDISAAALALVLFGEVYNAVSDVVGGAAAGGEAEAFVVNCWMVRVAVVDGVVEDACSSVFVVSIAWTLVVVMFVFGRDGSGIEDSASTAGFPASGVVVPCTGLPPFCTSNFPSFSFLDLLERIQFDIFEAMTSIKGVDESCRSCTEGAILEAIAAEAGEPVAFVAVNYCSRLSIA